MGIRRWSHKRRDGSLKLIYGSLEEAEVVALRLQTTDPLRSPRNAYRCPECEMYHVGRASLNKPKKPHKPQARHILWLELGVRVRDASYAENLGPPERRIEAIKSRVCSSGG